MNVEIYLYVVYKSLYNVKNINLIICKCTHMIRKDPYMVCKYIFIVKQVKCHVVIGLTPSRGDPL